MNPEIAQPEPSVTDELINAVLGRIPPLWPLKHFVAVNPFVGMLDQPFADACARVQTVTGALPLLSSSAYRELWHQGLITEADLEQVADAGWTSVRLLDLLTSDGPAFPGPVPTFADFIDDHSSTSHWSPLVVEEISKWCAVAFDENQTTWKSPWSDAGLYTGWKAAARLDRNPEAWGLRGFRGFVAGLPDDSAECIRYCMECLSPPVDAAHFLHRQLVTISGWAGYLQYRVREDAMRGRGNDSLRDLLAIRLAFDAALHAAFGDRPDLATAWRSLTPSEPDSDWIEGLTRWQRAYESGYQRSLAQILVTAPKPVVPARPPVQAVFCIDVRSELLRRHLEDAMPGLQSIGFAGFFGFPVAHETAPGESASRCPVLLVPPITTCVVQESSEMESTRTGRARSDAWRAIQNSAASCFSFVETLGLGFIGTLNRPTSTSVPACGQVRSSPRLRDSATPEMRASMAEGALRNMGLTADFARLVLLCGHGSQSANNPFASGLDCGACGGHAGDVNARIAAAALNNPEVRAVLSSQGIDVPADTWFVAGIHNTTTDQVSFLDEADVPESHRPDLGTLRMALTKAGSATRRERAARLLEDSDPEIDPRDAFVRRAADISELRPEWALANNAAFVAAPRTRTEGHSLEGRVFLHDYDEAADQDLRVLTLILCAPVVVASWINLQYYASRVNPDFLGSGNKALHNVLGGIGVVEGNGGDLRTGLPLQSLHDGEKFVHEPRRLSVFLQAGTDRIDEVLRSQPAVKQLFDHGWIHLFAFRDKCCERYTPRGWEVLSV
jgi:uncharacterized protein YbcC (UPF0753/DUF2309 family)